MARPKRRTKVISIRLSNEEFDELQSFCAARGGNNVSEFARSAMRLVLNQEHGARTNTGLEARMNDLNIRVSGLDREVARISRLVGLNQTEPAL